MAALETTTTTSSKGQMPGQHHLGSCEPCKKKKCKCDRKLPCCSQCTSLPSVCKYLHNNKRGIPGGYLTTLEQRLDQTENALYNALAELRALKSKGYTDECQSPTLISDRSALATKASRMEEWKTLPLKDLKDIQRWWDVVSCDKKDAETNPKGQSYDSHDPAQYPDQSYSSAQREDTRMERNTAGGNFHEQSSASPANLFMYEENPSRENDVSAMVFSNPEESGYRRVDGKHYFEPVTTLNGSTSPRTAAPLSRSTKLSKSQELTQAMKQRYY